MHCERARELLSPYLDGELSPEEQRSMAAHIEECDRCARLAEPSTRPHRPHHCRGGARAGPPHAGSARSRGAAPGGAAEGEGALLWPGPVAVGWVRARPQTGEAQGRAAACVLTALATWWVVSASDQQRRLEQEGCRLISAGFCRRGRSRSPPRYAHGQAVVCGPRRLSPRSRISRARAPGCLEVASTTSTAAGSACSSTSGGSTRSTCSCGRARGTRAPAALDGERATTG